MNHLKSILSKFVVYSIILLFVLLFYGLSVYSLLLLAAIIAIVTYIFGDLFILPLKGNLMATALNGLIMLVGILIWLASSFNLSFSLLGGAFFVAIIVTVCEWYLHIYLIGRMNRDNQEPTYD